mmetsp:Transcript_15075/g.14641  ORF Transcript_15075/g.14641 Transcript_15075/m.14641 type:complete len:111 (-) Transcript_15075:1953-2285(-)
MCMIYLLFVSYLSNTTTTDFKVWDVDTVTASDFTVEFIIHPQVWDEFSHSHHARMSNNKVTSFELYLKKEFEALIKDEPHVLDANESGAIANITFAFDNHEIINLLKKRG